jgi:hypothetical protein
MLTWHDLTSQHSVEVSCCTANRRVQKDLLEAIFDKRQRLYLQKDFTFNFA